MNTLKKQDIQQLEQLIDQVQVVSDTNVILIANNEHQAKMFKELLPGIKVICAYGRLETDDKIYIIPYEEKPIKFIYE